MSGPNRCTRHGGGVEQHDEMLYVIRNEGSVIVEAGIEEFAVVERLTAKTIKVTLRGQDGTPPVVLMLEAETPIVLREYGRRQ